MLLLLNLKIRGKKDGTAVLCSLETPNSLSAWTGKGRQDLLPKLKPPVKLYFCTVFTFLFKEAQTNKNNPKKQVVIEEGLGHPPPASWNVLSQLDGMILSRNYHTPWSLERCSATQAPNVCYTWVALQKWSKKYAEIFIKYMMSMS